MGVKDSSGLYVMSKFNAWQALLLQGFFICVHMYTGTVKIGYNNTEYAKVKQ